LRRPMLNFRPEVNQFTFARGMALANFRPLGFSRIVAGGFARGFVVTLHDCYRIRFNDVEQSQSEPNRQRSRSTRTYPTKIVVSAAEPKRRPRLGCSSFNLKALIATRYSACQPIFSARLRGSETGSPTFGRVLGRLLFCALVQPRLE
jgi:hypothetical protein